MIGKAWCPLFKQINMRPCPRPPNKDILLDKFWGLVDAMKFPMIGVDREKHKPDKRWLLDIIATFNPSDRIFDKDYQPPLRATQLDQIKAIPIPTAFVTGLPLSRRKSRRKGLRMTKEGLRA